MASEATKVVVLESVLRKRKREELWAATGKEKAVAEKKKTVESYKLIFARAKQYAEHKAKLRAAFLLSPFLLPTAQIRSHNSRRRRSASSPTSHSCPHHRERHRHPQPSQM
ncbi:hypothetical protein ABZP36_002283 [Zizania latifolia]